MGVCLDLVLCVLGHFLRWFPSAGPLLTINWAVYLMFCKEAPSFSSVQRSFSSAGSEASPSASSPAKA